MRKKYIASVLAAIITVAAGTVWSFALQEQEDTGPAKALDLTESKRTFSDIKGHWAEGIIQEAAALNIVGGYPGGTYFPDHLIKREEFFQLLTNILTNRPDISGTKIPFADVKEGSWYVPAIKAAVAAGITDGYQDGTFGVGRMISRQEAAKVAGSVISRPAKQMVQGEEEAGGTVASGVAGDSDLPAGSSAVIGSSAAKALDRDAIADWAYDYVDLMFRKGYMKGDSAGNFRPTMALTRAEAAAILLSIKKNEPVISPNADGFEITSCMTEHEGHEGVFINGEGTAAEPYEIASEEQLNHLRMHADDGAYYILTKNIAITKSYAQSGSQTGSGEPDWSAGNFVPIGSKAQPFKGTLDGNGYTVSGLNIYCKDDRNSGAAGEANQSCVGLFGVLAKESSVTNLIIDASNIQGGQYTGALAGYSEGLIENCRLGPKGIVTGLDVAGGLVGLLDQNAEISKSRNSGSVEGNSAGGIVGNNRGIVIDCYNMGKIDASENAGGIAAYQTNGEGRITRCYNEGRVNSKNFAGGIVGDNGAKTDNCYNSGRISAIKFSGGIAGNNADTITHVYGAGVVTGDGGAGSIAGKNAGAIRKAFWLGTTAASGIGVPGQNGSEETVRKLTHEELSGQTKILTDTGYESVLNILNESEKTWKFLYSYLPSENVEKDKFSDEGGSTQPDGSQSEESRGNVIDPNDLATKYLYPVLIQ
ncbi:S-layer homology domain-containing protein [Anoxybacterium hadale]|uniref:S-layer homology domain-containing protein n=1 Tax=Anoxybacterium hadale TaxID=3408580 RepID=A0ACD1AFW4_9FIRM|nr:S-layer homology domain-containing protein [Clostridiales bacterium]